MSDALRRFRDAGWTLPDGSPLPADAAGMARLRMTAGRRNKRCGDCGLACHPARTACPDCGGTLSVPAPEPEVEG